jgi:hypothetical protein
MFKKIITKKGATSTCALKWLFNLITKNPNEMTLAMRPCPFQQISDFA